MDLQQLGMAILWFFLYGYVIIASIDFGAGFFSYYSHVTGQHHRINAVIKRYLSPVWEVTNVFFVFFFVGIVGFFPDTAYYYGTALLLPGSISLVLLAIRGSFYAFSYAVQTNRVYAFLYGVSGLFIPASLSVVFVLSEGGYIVKEGERVRLLAGELITSAYAWLVVVLAVSSVLFISASFLTYYASRAKDMGALSVIRTYALIWSVPMIISGIMTFLAMSEHNRHHFNKMVDLWPLFTLSFLCFLVGIRLMWKGQSYGFAFLAVMLQYFFAFFAYGASHLPYLLYPYVTIYSGAVNVDMGMALLVGFVGGLMLLIPAIYLLMQLFLFDSEYIQGKKK